MEVSAILKARAIARLDIDELNFGGRIRLLDMVPALIAEYGFLKYPSTPEDFDLSKGVTFASGMSGNNVIDTLVLYNGLIFLETLSSTEDAKDRLLELLAWGRDSFGLSYREGMIERWAYISQIAFRTDHPLLVEVSQALGKLGHKLTAAVDGLFEEGLVFETASVTVGHDPLRRSSSVAGFSIQHRVGFQFKDNRYFSEAPLPTALHIKLLGELESDVKSL